jgi:ferritin
MTTHIHWEQAVTQFKHQKEEDLVEAKRIIEEIERSNFEVLDSNDVHWYASTLNELVERVDENGKPNPYTANEIRRINMKAKGLNSFDFMHTFIDDETDDIIDFY